MSLPISVAFSELPELYSDDACEGRSYQTALQRTFAHTAREQVNVVYSRVDALEPVDEMSSFQ